MNGVHIYNTRNQGGVMLVSSNLSQWIEKINSLSLLLPYEPQAVTYSLLSSIYHLDDIDDG